MFYILYLSSLCKRRRWPDPHFECYPCGNGYNSGFTCNVRVNHRDYTIDSIHATEDLAREAAAMRAYLICRNLSVNESLYPGSGGLVPSLPTNTPPPQITTASTTMANRGYAPPVASRAMAVQPNQMISGQGHGRMGNPQGVIVVGHSQQVTM